MRLFVVAVLWLGCADDSLGGVGEPCNSSGDCAAGLLCDFSNRKMHTCQPAGPLRDFATPIFEDLSMPDSGAAD
jgi:hypothetical protein